MVKCGICKVYKSYDSFHRSKSSITGRINTCKPCRSIQEKERRSKPEVRERIKTYWNENKGTINAKKRKKYKESEERRELAKQRVYAWRIKKYGDKQKAFREKRERIKKEKQERREWLEYRKEHLTPFIKRMRTALWTAFKRDKYYNNSKFDMFKYIGCSFEDLKTHIESMFVVGMSWDNKGDWEIDHIIPFSSGKTIEEVILLCHFSNIQPLWCDDHRSKGRNIPNVTNLHYRKTYG